MLKVVLFLVKNKILKSPDALASHVKEFFKLSKKNQRRVLDKYFNSIDEKEDVVSYFLRSEARYFEDEHEVNMFSCYYFDKLLIEHNVYNIRYIDKFNLDKEKLDYLVNYALYIIKEKFNTDSNILYSVWVNYLKKEVFKYGNRWNYWWRSTLPIKPH